MDAHTKYPDHMITEANWPRCVGIAFNLREELHHTQAENAKLLADLATLSAKFETLTKRLEQLEQSMSNSDSE
jgi:predicted nuclease with TOPRIM domain